jgi:TonB family protein
MNKQFFSVRTSGYFIDSNLIRQQQKKLRQEQAKLREIEKNKRKDYLKNHFKNGQLKEIVNKNPEHDSIPVKTSYYEDGTVRLYVYKRKGIVKEAYDRSGHLKNTWDDQGIRTEYHPNGNRKFRSGVDRYSAENPYLSFYFENGCLKKEVFLNEAIIKEYDSLKCNQLIAKTIKDSTIFNNSIAYYEGGKISCIKFFPHMGSSQHVEHTGTFQGYKLTDGYVNYYSTRNKLLFSSQIIHGKRDNVLTRNEKQGDQINLFDDEGRKTGLWVMQKSNDSVPIRISSNLKESLSDLRDVAWRNYIYDKGDTTTMVYFHDYGEVKGYVYLQDREMRIKQGREVGIGYHENGYLKSKRYELKNGLSVLVNYSEENENEIVGGTKGHRSVLIYKKNQLVEIKSLYKAPPPVADAAKSNGKARNLQDGMSAVEKGNFKHFELYNGFMYYYDQHENLSHTEKVVNGVIQWNPRVKLKEKQLVDKAKQNDLNMNGWVEQRELNGLTSLSIRLTDEEVESFNWKELAHFKNLQAVNCNNLSYQMSDYTNLAALKSAVVNKSGTKIERRRHRYSWEPPREPDFDLKQERVELAHVEKIVAFPDVEAKFPGGQEAMIQWIDSNMVRPTVDTDSRQYKVYIEFNVHRDGSISNVKLLRGVQAEFDREAKRLVRSMPNWEPAISKGEACTSKMRIPITFKLN